jgi:hypothetical protein
MRKRKECFFAALSGTALPLLVFALGSFAPAACPAQEAVAVLAKGSGLYFDTFLAFQKAFGRPVAAFDLSLEKPSLHPDLRAAVAFGAKAAAFDYPETAKLIYLMAPGYMPRKHGGGATKISTLPEPAQAVAAYKELQPGLGRLAVFHSKSTRSAYIAELTAAARSRGVEIIAVGLGGPGEFPDRLRALVGKIDAFWLLPEPTLINRTSLLILGEFSCANKLPFYAPAAGLTDLGAAAAFSPNFTEAGITAAAALKKALAGEKLPSTLYVARSELTVNGAFIKKCGLPVALPAAMEARK